MIDSKTGIPIPKYPTKKVTSKDLIGYGVLKHWNENNETAIPNTIFWTPTPIPTDKKGATAIEVEIKNPALGEGIASGSLIHNVQKDKTIIMLKAIATFPSIPKEYTNENECKDLKVELKK